MKALVSLVRKTRGRPPRATSGASGHEPSPRPRRLNRQLELPVEAPARPETAGPFLKWAGGKTQLLPFLRACYPPAGTISGYLEPFVGAGSVFFDVARHLLPTRTTLLDSNEELIGAYQALRDDAAAVIAHLRAHARAHDSEHFYRVRAQQPARLSAAGRAARVIYLNKTCFNGLYRVNSKNQFNVPMGRYAKPSIFDADNLHAVGARLAGVGLHAGDFRRAAEFAQEGDFVYFDPPYDPLSPTAHFTSYTQGGFGPEDQADLAALFRTLSERGCHVMLSNNLTPRVRSLYHGFFLKEVPARRNINTRKDRRGPIDEALVMNYRIVCGRLVRIRP